MFTDEEPPKTSLQVNSKQMLTKTGFMDKNLSFPLWGMGVGVLENAKQIFFWDKGKGNNTYKELLNTVSLLSNTSLIRPQEQAGRSIHADEVDYVLPKCHMLSITPKKTVCAQKHY